MSRGRANPKKRRRQTNASKAAVGGIKAYHDRFVAPLEFRVRKLEEIILKSLQEAIGDKETVVMPSLDCELAQEDEDGLS